MQVRTAVAGVAALLLSGVAMTPSAAHAVVSPTVMTMSSWDGVTLGSSLTSVAAAHGWSTTDCGDGIPAAISGIWRYGVEVAVGETPGSVGFIEVSSPAVRGPRGLRVGLRISQLSALLRRGEKHHAADGTVWYYWLIPVRAGYLYVRTGGPEAGGRRVGTFGLAASRTVADGRGRTEGGCI